MTAIPPDLESRHQLEALYHLSVELSGLRDVQSVLDVALRQCLTLTESQFGFIGLCGDDPGAMEIAAIHGFHPTRMFYERHRLIPLRPNVFANAVLEDRPVRSADARQDPVRVGQPKGHPEVRTFLGVPLRLDDQPIGMIGVANRPSPYLDSHQRLLLTYAAQVAILIRNAQLYEQLARANEELEATVDERTAQLQVTSRELAEKASELASVLSETVDAQEQERQRIARDVHDGINQLLIGAMLELTSGRQRLERGAIEEAGEALGSCQSILRRVESEIRRVVHDLHPPVLEGLGLPAALRRLCDEVAHHTGLACRAEIDGMGGRLPGRLEISLYRIAQEALHNTATHAMASNAQVEVRFDNGGQRLILEVRDDGRGFEVAAAPPDGRDHLGLRSMRHRAESLGGKLHIQSAPGKGTSVRAVIPLPA